MKIALSFWGVLADFHEHRDIHVDTPDGHRYGRALLIRALQARRHEVYALQDRREPLSFRRVKYVGDHKLEHVDDLDVIFLEWRWSTYKNDPNHPQYDPKRHEPDLLRQREIIEYYRGKVPIIAWDTDLKITPEDERAYPELILADPALNPRTLTRPRVSLPFWTDWGELFPVVEPYPIYGYIGNNYERPDEFRRFYFDASEMLRRPGVQTSMYGNWLQASPERESPSSLIVQNPTVSFNDRRNFYDSMSIMNRFVATTHVSKPEYYRTGFISPRYLEALACNCPGLVPAAQSYNGILGREWIVGGPSDVEAAVSRIRRLDLDGRRALLHSQREACRRSGLFDVERVVRFIEDQAR